MVHCSAQMSMELDPFIDLYNNRFKPKRWLIHTFGGSLIGLSGLQRGRKGKRKGCLFCNINVLYHAIELEK